MTKKARPKPSPTQADPDPADTPATTLGEQGGTSQPGPPLDPDEDPKVDPDFSKPVTGEGGTDKS